MLYVQPTGDVIILYKKKNAYQKISGKHFLL